jgi:hypothetical protein
MPVNLQQHPAIVTQLNPTVINPTVNSLLMSLPSKHLLACHGSDVYEVHSSVAFPVPQHCLYVSSPNDESIMRGFVLVHLLLNTCIVSNNELLCCCI